MYLSIQTMKYWDLTIALSWPNIHRTVKKATILVVAGLIGIVILVIQ